MTALTDAEIITALPSESRQKINNAFEALSQSSPSPTEQAILYRVAHTLKLNPTDTVFSFVSALHLYLQLYQEIPAKISKAGGEIREAGADVDAAIRKATKETLTEHAGTLKAQAELLATQNQQALIRDVGKIAQRIAGNTAAVERQRSFTWAAGSMTVFGMALFGAGMALDSRAGLGVGFLAAIALGVGLVSGLVLCQVLIASGQVLPIRAEKSDFIWTPSTWLRAAQEIRPALEPKVAAASKHVLLGNKSVSNAAKMEKVFPAKVKIALQQFRELEEKY